MNFLERATWVLDTVRNQLWLQRNMAIGPTDLVLDVGSGGGPNPRANVLCDKFINDPSERGGQNIFHDRPFIVGDLLRLPFKDHVFDFVICSHVLEHVDDPASAIKELQRVATRGYIETPSASWEKLTGFPFHRWAVSAEGDELQFMEKETPLWDPELREWFAKMQEKLGISRKVWFKRRQLGVFTALLWEGEIKFVVHERKSGNSSGFHHAQVQGGMPEDEVGSSNGKAFGWLLAWYGRRLRRDSDPRIFSA